MKPMTESRIVDLSDRIDWLERRAALSALWMFVLLNFIFRDLHEIVKADFLADALNGIYDGRQVEIVPGAVDVRGGGPSPGGA
jgi:hypothetical protein